MIDHSGLSIPCTGPAYYANSYFSRALCPIANYIYVAPIMSQTHSPHGGTLRHHKTIIS